MITEVEIKASPKQLAELIWDLDSDEQAEMLSELLKAAGSEHVLMTQFMHVRDYCEVQQKKHDGNHLDAFQCMYASAFKYMLADHLI